MELGECETFDPKNKKFIFHMPGNECEYKSHGVCPIKENKDIECKCKDILRQLEKASFKQNRDLPIVLYDEEKDLYGADDGQHRICIAIQLNMKIMIHKTKEHIRTGTIYDNPNAPDQLKVPF